MKIRVTYLVVGAVVLYVLLMCGLRELGVFTVGGAG